MEDTPPPSQQPAPEPEPRQQPAPEPEPRPTGKHPAASGSWRRRAHLPRLRVTDARAEPGQQAGDGQVGPLGHSPPRPSPPVTYIAFEPRELRRATVTVLLLVGGFGLATWAYDQVGHFLFLLLLAWLVAIALEPSVAFFERRGQRRGLGAGLTLAAMVVLSLVFLAVFGSLLVTQLADLIASLPSLVAAVVEQLNRTFNLQLNPNTVADQLNLDAATVASVGSELAGGVVGVFTWLVGVLFDLVTVLVFSFYIAADGPRLRRAVGAWMPPRSQRVFVQVWEISLVKTGGFVSSKFILGGVSGLAHTVFFALIDIPYWLPLGIFAGLTSQFIPTIGTYIGVAVPILIAGFSEALDAIWIVIFATVYQQIENYLLTPRVSRATMDIHPAIALGAVFVGAALFGPIGALIGIPLAAAVVAVVDTYTERYDLVPELLEPA